MCLAIPGKVVEITTDGLIRMGRVNFGGVVKNVCLDYVPEVEVGDYTIVHVGFALSKIDEETAEQTLKEFREMGALDEELGTEEEAFARAAEADGLPGWKLFCRARQEGCGLSLLASHPFRNGAERMGHPLFPDGEFEREFTVGILGFPGLKI
jgi:hydrogenase expression/formation protein HypC